MSRLILPLLLASLLIIPAGAQRMDKDSSREPPSLTATGTGEVQVAPDEATVRLGVTRQAATAGEAQSLVNEVASAILEGVVRVGVPRERIQTSQLTLFPVYSESRPRAGEEPAEPRIVGYRAQNTVSIRLDVLDKVGPVVDAALKAGANQLEGVHFTLRNDAAAREQAMRDAIREARGKARTMSEALEVRLMEVLEVNEGGVSVRPVFFGGGAQMAAMARGGAADTPVSPGQVTVGASVTVRYRISGR